MKIGNKKINASNELRVIFWTKSIKDRYLIEIFIKNNRLDKNTRK